MVPNEQSPLGSALAQCLSIYQGIVAAYFPDGVAIDLVESVVRRANELCPSDPPFAIFVQAGDNDLSDPTCQKVNPETAIKYRKGPRLAVKIGPPPDLTSFHAYRSVLDSDFPANASGSLTLELIAKQCVREIMDAAGISTSAIWDREEAEGRLCSSFEDLKSVYELLGQGSLAWNVYWFEHVDRGLKRLIESLRTVRETNPAMSLDDFFRISTYASFALPLPAGSGGLGSTGNVGKEVVDALSDWWSDELTILSTVDALATHPDTHGEQHGLAELTWAGFGRTVASYDNLLLAFSNHCNSGPDLVAAFSKLTERQFFNPLSIDRTNNSLRIRTPSGQTLAIGDAQRSFVVATENLDIRNGSFLVTSETVVVEVPWLDSNFSGELDPEMVAKSRISLDTSAAEVQWNGGIALLEDGSIGLIGTFAQLSTSDPCSNPGGLFTVSLSVPEGDPLRGIVAHQADAQVLIAAPVDIGVAVFRQNSGAARLTLTKQYSADDAILGELEFSIDGGRSYLVIAWGSDELTINGQSQPAWENRSGFWLGGFHAVGNHVVSAGPATAKFVVPESRDSALSPLIAAMTGRKISEESPSMTTQSSIRGQVEELIAEQCLSDDWLRTMGHVIVASDRDADIRSLETVAGGFLIPSGFATEWRQSQFGFEVSRDVLDSEPAEEFRRAFTSLLGAFPLVRYVEGEPVRSWPSRLSWAELWSDRGLLADYLNAYSELVTHAKRTASPASVFWASYPFSVSVWATGGEGCDAVLLSPLHPIRLAWLAASEWVLRQSGESRQLGGTIEGWNFPILGPRTSQSGRMLAVPLENGEEQLFLGWSMLVKVSVDEPAPLKLPTWISGLPSPGASASGLNASSVEAAVRDYRRVNPHVSTLTVDLAATDRIVRTREIDSAVLAASGVLRGNTIQSHFSGGLRVRDSLHRLGESPRDEISAVLAKYDRVPISWSRYAPSERTETCNLRILQDSGVRVSVIGQDGANKGLIGEVPIRRFDFAPAIVRGAASWSCPALSAGQGWEPFTHAIRLLEDADSQPVVKAQLYRSLLVDSRADWTVSGECLVTPAAMARLVGAGGEGEQMLWEWRPPFLAPTSSSGAAPLERRPYVSVARIPGGFREQIRQILSVVLGSECPEEFVASLLTTLGSKGVGLSSLTTMGGTHAAGAIGFFLTLSLIEQADRGDADQFVLPLDACDGFLRALGGAATLHESSQRADLLVIRVYDDRIVMCPIEIKFYGLLAAEPPERLPTLQDGRLAKSISQLQATYSVLKRVAKASEEVVSDPESGQSRLWANGLLTLIDAAVRLGNPETQASNSIADRLQMLANGRMPVVIGRSVVCFFGHNATSEDGSDFRTELKVAEPDGPLSYEVALLAANSGSVLNELQSNYGSVAEALSSLMAWACEIPASRVEPMPVPTESSGRVEDKGVDLTQTNSGASDDEPATANNDSPSGSESTVDRIEFDDQDFASDIERNPDGIRFTVGDRLGSIAKSFVDFWPSNTDLSQINVGVVGNLGTGKTQLLKALMLNLRRSARRSQDSPLSILVFDYKRDYQDEEFLNSVGGSVLHAEQIPLNVFSLADSYSPLRAYQKAQSFIDVLTKIYGGIGPVQINNLTTAITDLFAEQSGIPPTLSDVLDRYKQIAGQLDAVVSVLNPFVLGQIFSDKSEDLKSFEEILDNRVVVVSLSDLGNDQRMKNALVVLFLNMYYEYMLRQEKHPFTHNEKGTQLRTVNSFLLVDEATQIMQYEFDVLMDLMLQGREFGTGVILASQYLSHFKVRGTNYGEPLLTWFIHNVPAVTKQQLASLGISSASDEMAARIPTLSKHQALYRSLGVSGEFIRCRPFYEMIQDEF